MTAPTLPSAFNFRTSFTAYVPGWLSAGNGYAYLYTLEACRDLVCERAFEAMTIRLPGVGDASNLPWLSYDRNLQQGPAESNMSFASRLADAFQAWGEAGSASAVLEQLQAYMSNLQPGVAATLPLATIVSSPTNTSPSYVTWNQLYQGDVQGAPATLTTVSPGNFSWDGLAHTCWWRWLVLPMSLVPVAGLSGSAAATSTAASSACFTVSGQNVGGVWVPTTSGTPVDAPWITLTGLTGLTSAQVGQWITLSGSGHAGNNGTFPIVSVTSATSCVIANPGGVASDTGPLAWTISAYPFIGPGPAWGAPGYVFGEGEAQVPYLESTALAGTFDVVTGSASIFRSSALLDVLPFQCVTFSAQPGVSYPVLTVGVHSLTLAVPYTGTTNASAAQLVVIDVGSLSGGVWQPSTAGGGLTSLPTISWGLSCSSLVIASIRAIVKTWKSAGTYYPNIIVAFDASAGAAGSAYSPNSAEGSGNPDGTFGDVGQLVGGVWSPTRLITSPWDAYCQGTGIAQNCSIENLT